MNLRNPGAFTSFVSAASSVEAKAPALEGCLCAFLNGTVPLYGPRSRPQSDPAFPSPLNPSCSTDKFKLNGRFDVEIMLT